MGTYLILMVRCRFGDTARRLIGNLEGATAVEYGLLAGLVAVGIAAGLGALSDLVLMIFNMLGDRTTEVADGIGG